MAEKGDARVAEITEADYDKHVSRGVVLIDFWAPWCGPCRMQGPVVEAIAEKYAGRIAVYACNVDENPDLASRLEIYSIPTLVLYRDGEAVERFVGVTPQHVIEEIIEFELSP